MIRQGEPRLTDGVRDGLVRLIASDNLPVGAKLPTAEQLCLRFGVSRTVVREAIASLEAEGRLISKRGSGVYVSDATPVPTGPSVMRSPNDIAEMLEFMELRMSVEIEAAGIAAERRTETDLLRIEQAMINFEQHLQGKTIASDVDRALHLSIAQATGNPKFSEFVDRLGERLIPRRALGADFADADEQISFLRKIHTEHRVIADAIAERQPETARDSMRIHLDNGRRRYRNWTLEHFADASL
ncbi:FadR family transcriptional regulator [Devosia sp. BK]|uniref:FadR/GntR family transcriptional regulator n=1 Tax=Devosia sp. BK TaxID=2871706 RepID=UPI00293A38A3|nr:FadR/GntR family transcriptional regulator [Devosia sp. BK]MDV3253715.1 FadR family transcriptional regulator [Devosia sp. BK]